MSTEIIANVENMSSAEYLSIIDNMSKFYNYSFNNKMILAFQGCSQVKSFKKWKELDRNVIKGENGQEVEKVAIIGYRAVPVFDITQTEGKEIERGLTTKAEISLDHVLKAAKALNVTVDFKPLEIAIGGYVSTNEIVLNANLSEVENIGTLIHELAHFILGHTSDSETAKDAKEQEGETVTALICSEFGIDRKSEFYLKGWGTKNILAAMPKMSKAYAEIKKVLVA